MSSKTNAILQALLDNKKEYTEHMKDLLTEPLVDIFERVYKESLTSSEVRTKGILVVFQEQLANVVNWNASKVLSEYEQVVSATACSYLPDLFRSVIVTQVKINLLVNQRGAESVKVKMPTPDNFLHRCIMYCARMVWKKPYLLYHKARSLERQQYLNELESLIHKAIATTVRSYVPMVEIAKDDPAVQREKVSDSESEDETESEEESESEEEEESDSEPEDEQQKEEESEEEESESDVEDEEESEYEEESDEESESDAEDEDSAEEESESEAEDETLVSESEDPKLDSNEELVSEEEEMVSQSESDSESESESEHEPVIQHARTPLLYVSSSDEEEKHSDLNSASEHEESLKESSVEDDDVESDLDDDIPIINGDAPAPVMASSNSHIEVVMQNHEPVIKKEEEMVARNDPSEQKQINITLDVSRESSIDSNDPVIKVETADVVQEETQQNVINIANEAHSHVPFGSMLLNRRMFHVPKVKPKHKKTDAFF